MKKFDLKKPMVESALPPRDTNVLWVNKEEGTDRILSIKEWKNGEWQLLFWNVAAIDADYCTEFDVDGVTNKAYKINGETQKRTVEISKGVYSYVYKLDSSNTITFENLTPATYKIYLQPEKIRL